MNRILLNDQISGDHPRRSPGWPQLPLAGICLLWLTGLIGCQGDVARWEFAQAQLSYDAGETDESVKQMRAAVDKSGEHWELALPFAIALSKESDPEAIQVCDRVLAQDEVRENEARYEFALNIKIECLCNLSQYSAALSTLKKLYSKRVQRDYVEENRLAYHRALAGEELELAYRNIGAAIQAIETSSDWHCGERLTLPAKSIVSAALLARHFHVETQQDPSLESFAESVQRLRMMINFLSRAIDEFDRRYGFIIECTDLENESAVSLERCTARSNVVVLLTVRALVFQDLNDPERSNLDRYRATQMTKEIEKVIQGLPDERTCLNLLHFATAFLDTRGFIQSQLPWPSKLTEETKDKVHSSYLETLGNLDTAILACQIESRALRGGLMNNVNLSVAGARKLQRNTKRNEAVLRSHRLLAHERAGDTKRAEADRAAIIELGFQPGHQLF